MNILFIEYAHAHFYQQRKLVADGHNVYTTWDDWAYNRQFGIQHADCGYWIEWTPENYKSLTDQITKLQIDVVINGVPWVSWVRDILPAGVKYLGGTKEACEVETNKFDTRKAVAELGLNVAPLVGEGRTTDLDLSVYTKRPVVVKAKNSFNPALIIGEGQDEEMVMICNRMTATDHYDYFLEEFLPNIKIEVEVQFMIAGGKWAVTYIGGMGGESDRRCITMDSDCGWMPYIKVLDLTPDVEAAVMEFATTFLDWLALKGGNYHGSLDVVVDENNEVYWIECNTRHDAYNCLPCEVSGDVYLDALTNDPNKYATDQTDFNLTTIVSLVNNDPLQEYPYHLHAEYGVEVPNCLMKEDDVYRSYCAAVVIPHRGELPTGFLSRLTATQEYGVL